MTATVVRPGDFTGPVYAVVEDAAGVILPNAQVLAVSQSEYSVVLPTSPSLAPGVYSGNFTVKLCRDAACASQYAGSPMLLPYAFTVTAAAAQRLAAAPLTTLAASMHLGGPAPRNLAVVVTGRNLRWSASSTVGWARPGSREGTGDASVGIDIDATGLQEGRHEGEIRIATADGQSVVLPVSLTLLASVFQTTSDGFVFNAINGAPVATQEVGFALDSQLAAPWTLASNRTWLGITPASGTTPGKATLAPDASRGSLASGSHDATLTLSSPIAKDRLLPVQFRLAKATLNSSLPAVVLGGTYGREFPAVPLTLSLNTGARAWPWTLGALPGWAQPSASAGSVNESGSIVTITPDRNQAAVGSTTVMMNAQAVINGDTVTRAVPLTINRDQQKILPSLTGIGLVATPGWSRLSRTVTVSDNFESGAAWTAASDKGWLTVTRSGATLTLTANPATLPADATSYATVTLTPSTAGVTAPETIRVALWKGSSAPAAATALNVRYTELVADPIRPHVYVHAGGTSIDVYNVYTAQKIATLALGGEMGHMTVSQDGAHLYVYDMIGRSVVVVDLATQARSATWPQPNRPVNTSRLLSIRPNGVEIVLTSSGAYRARDGARLSDTWYFGANLTASQDGKRVWTEEFGGNGSGIGLMSMDYSEMAGGTLFKAKMPTSGFVPASYLDLALNADGTRIYSASGSPYACQVSSTAGSVPEELYGIGPYPNNVEIDSFGRIFCGRDWMYGEPDVYVYNPDGTLRGSFALGGKLLTRQLAVSADGMMMVALTEDPYLSINAVGP